MKLRKIAVWTAGAFLIGPIVYFLGREAIAAAVDGWREVLDDLAPDRQEAP